MFLTITYAILGYLSAILAIMLAIIGTPTTNVMGFCVLIIALAFVALFFKSLHKMD